jgi:hypothetical protein
MMDTCDVFVLQSHEAPEASSFFAPVPSDAIDSLLSHYAVSRARLDEVVEMVQCEAFASVFGYFADGNATDQRGRLSLSLSCAQLFDKAGALGSLTAGFWSKALHLTDVLDYMPQQRRDEWHKSITNPLGIKAQPRRPWDTAPAQEWDVEPLPEFTEATVRGTIESLLSMRALFLAERVDGIFRGLSGDHVTNAPEGFRKRMILARALSSYGWVESHTAGLINDLRCVVAKFMGRDEPKFTASSSLLESLKHRWGQWVSCDGGALRVRLYRKGTAHLEVHPDMAYRLNQVLAHLHPSAIPAEFRTKPARRVKEFGLMARPLPFAVLETLGDLRPIKGRLHAREICTYGAMRSRHALEETRKVLQLIGGAQESNNVFLFDFPPDEIIEEIVLSGCVPDYRSHQFYPTPESLAQRVIELAEIGETHSCLEPSAGIGSLAKFMPLDRTLCVEISSTHAAILKAQGFAVAHADFLDWAATPGQSFSRIALNPPFSEGRWRAHLEAATKLLEPGGRLVAILPAGARSWQAPANLACTWHGPYANEFAATSVSVSVLVAERSSL